jgi:hypothetical protein
VVRGGVAVDIGVPCSRPRCRARFPCR